MSPLLWTAIGIGLIALELVVPGIFLVWFGGAALLTAGAAWLSGGWPLLDEVALFTALSGAAVCIAMIRARRRPRTADPGGINDRAGQLRGRRVVLAEPIANGRGRVFIGDTLWTVEGPDGPAGTAVTVTGHRGMVLTVEPATASPASSTGVASR